MGVFMLILRIIMLVAFFVGLIISLISGAVASSKKFNNETLQNHYKVKIKLIGIIIMAAAVAVLMILSLV